MLDSDVERVIISERPNGWWVTVERPDGHKEHHGPYVDEELARIEANTFSDEVETQDVELPMGHHNGDPTSLRAGNDAQPAS